VSEVIELVIVTPQGEAFRGSVEGVVLPGSEGDFGVLEGHERFLCPLRPGQLEIKASSGSQFAAIGSGFADVNGAEAAVMVESCEIAGDIDVARAETARNRAEQGLADSKPDEDAANHGEHAAALVRAENRIAVASKR
jgi:F-type H+-transporting ATPase subunit epsilon